MKLTAREIDILNALQQCSFLPGSYPKRLVRDLNPKQDVSPLQRYYLHWFGFRYRKQIDDLMLTAYCQRFLNENAKPMSRKETEKILRRAMKKSEPPRPPQSESHTQTTLF